MADIASPVPLGRSNTGAAVEYGSGLGALNYLIRTDAMEAAARARQAAAAAKQKEADEKDFASRIKLDPQAGVHFVPLIQKLAASTYQQMEALATSPGLSRNQRAIDQQKLVDEHNRIAAASTKVDAHLADLGTRVTSDKRYDRDKTLSKLYGTLYKKGEDGSPVTEADGKPGIVSPLEYDPQTAEAAIGEGNEHLNGVKVFEAYLRGKHADSITYAKEALPGGKGFRNIASSDVYELTPDGQKKYDPATNLPVVKATPQALNYFDSDPINKQYLDGFEKKHQAQLATAVEKMNRYEELTPEEADAVEVEKSPAGRRMELFKRGLMEQGYSRQSTTILAKAAPRPRVGRKAAGPKFTQEGVSQFTPGVVGGVAGSNTEGIAHYGISDPLRRETSNGDIKPYVANVTHRQYLMSDGGRLKQVSNNSAPQELEYQAPVVLLRSPTGNAVFPTDPAIVAATERGDMGPLEAWTRRERARDPRLKPAYYMQAVPAKRADLQVGSADEVFDQLKAKEQAFRQAYSAGESGLAGVISDPGQSDEDRQRATMMAQLLKSGKQPPRFFSDAELREQARKLYGNKNATLYVPYSGAEKLTVDANTGYALRDPKRAKAMNDYLTGVDNRTRPGDTEKRDASRGRGPLAGAVAPAPAAVPAKAATKPAAAPANRFGFKFKKL